MSSLNFCNEKLFCSTEYKILMLHQESFYIKKSFYKTIIKLYGYKFKTIDF